MARVTMNIQTLDWTMGETVGLHLKLKKDCKARIAWGDGKVQVLTGKQKIGKHPIQAVLYTSP